MQYLKVPIFSENVESSSISDNENVIEQSSVVISDKEFEESQQQRSEEDEESKIPSFL